MRHLISISDLSPEMVASMVDQGLEIIEGKWDDYKPLAGMKVGIFFRRSSTRTRTAFTTAAINLGAIPVTFGPNDLQLTTGESVEDTGRVLSEYLDAFVMRTNDPISEMRAMAAKSTMPIINAMSDNEHPTQVIGDMITLKEAFGNLEGLHVLYIGEGNNTASALALAVSRFPGMRLTLVTPKGFGVKDEMLDEAIKTGRSRDTTIEQHHDVKALPKNVDAVYATRWETMGVVHADPNWRDKFIPYRVDQTLMETVSKPEKTIFMHDLPAMRGSDVTDEVLDGPQSVAFRQARHKLTSAMVVLNWCVGASPGV
jgi:ornithine carbamoyltransferase